MENKFLMLLKSRKFWAALVGLVLMFVQTVYPDFPVGVEDVVDPAMQLLGVAIIAGAYILGTGIEDSKK